MNLSSSYKKACLIVGEEPLFGLKHDWSKSQLLIDSPIVNKLREQNEKLLLIFKKEDKEAEQIIERNRKLAEKIESQLTILTLEAQQEDKFIENFSDEFINQIWFENVYDYFLNFYNNRVAKGDIT